MYKKWREDRSFLDRMRFMLGSYNAGFRTILTAQKLSRKNGFSGRDWESIKSVAPRVSKWREKETLGYVRKIEKLMGDPKESDLAAFVKKYW
jgi:membrane-bound lytic murein transglycosylase F